MSHRPPRRLRAVHFGNPSRRLKSQLSAFSFLPQPNFSLFTRPSLPFFLTKERASGAFHGRSVKTDDGVGRAWQPRMILAAGVDCHG